MTHYHQVLLIGATGRLGLQIIRAASSPITELSIHAFCRTPSKLPAGDASACASVVQGDARSSSDVRRALQSTKATIVIMSIGEGDSTAPTNLRAATAKALMDVIEPGQDMDHVKVVVVSSTGAGGTKIDIGYGIGMLLTWQLRHGMKDHTEQEEEFQRRIGDAQRLLILRPTGLTDGKANGMTTTFPKNTRVPCAQIDRKDLAQFIVAEIGKGAKAFGKETHVTGVRK